MKLSLKERKCLGFKKACLHRAMWSSDPVENWEQAGASSNLPPGGPGGQIGSPVHRFSSPPLCTVRTANRIHAAATVVSY